MFAFSSCRGLMEELRRLHMSWRLIPLWRRFDAIEGNYGNTPKQLPIEGHDPPATNECAAFKQCISRLLRQESATQFATY